MFPRSEWTEGRRPCVESCLEHCIRRCAGDRDATGALALPMPDVWEGDQA